MAEPFDQGEFKRAAFSPEITLEVYHQLPEDVCMQVEVVDGWMVRCESPTYSHQTIAHNFVSLLRDPVKNADRKERTCHRVVADLDMLIAEAPKFCGSPGSNSTTDCDQSRAGHEARSVRPKRRSQDPSRSARSVRWPEMSVGQGSMGAWQKSLR